MSNNKICVKLKCANSFPLLGNKLFADVTKLRHGHTGLGGALNPIGRVLQGVGVWTQTCSTETDEGAMGRQR